MSIKSISIFIFRVFLLTITLTICNIIGGIISGLSNMDMNQSTEGAGNAFSILLIVNAIHSIVIAFVLLRTRWRGWKLVLAVAVIYFGITTFMSQLETLFFGKAMGITNELLAQIVLSGAVTAALYAPLAVLIFRKMKEKSETNGTAPWLHKSLCWKLPILVMLYVVLYFTFGYFIAWQSSAVRLYYTQSTELLPFAQHIIKTLNQDAGLFLFQLFRGLLWIGFILLILQCCKGKKWELAILAGLIVGPFFTMQLFLPNPFMPYDVRMIHFVETASSTFLFGVIAVLLLYDNRKLNGV